MKGAKHFVLDDPIYLASWMVRIGGTLQGAIDAYAKRIGVEPWKVAQNRQYGHFAAYRPGKNGVIWIGNKCWHDALAHECFHATAYLFESLECKLGESTEEVFAYYLQWLMREILLRS